MPAENPPGPVAALRRGWLRVARWHGNPAVRPFAFGHPCPPRGRPAILANRAPCSSPRLFPKACLRKQTVIATSHRLTAAPGPPLLRKLSYSLCRFLPAAGGTPLSGGPGQSSRTRSEAAQKGLATRSLPNCGSGGGCGPSVDTGIRQLGLAISACVIGGAALKPPLTRKSSYPLCRFRPAPSGATGDTKASRKKLSYPLSYVRVARSGGSSVAAGTPWGVLVAVTALFGAPTPSTGRAAINMGTRPLAPGALLREPL